MLDITPSCKDEFTMCTTQLASPALADCISHNGKGWNRHSLKLQRPLPISSGCSNWKESIMVEMTDAIGTASGTVEPESKSWQIWSVLSAKCLANSSQGATEHSNSFAEEAEWSRSQTTWKSSTGLCLANAMLVEEKLSLLPSPPQKRPSRL